MIEVLAIAGGLGTAGALVAVVVMAFRLSAAKDAVIAKTAALADSQVQSAQIQAKLVDERDTALTRASTLAAEVADRDMKIRGLEQQLADLAAKFAREKLARIASQPPSQDGADAVNELFATPIGKESKKP